MRKRIIGSALSLALLLAVAPVTSTAAAPSVGAAIIPAALGPSALVTTELNSYSAFPVGVELPDGSGYLIGYSVSDQHWDNTTTHRFRYSPDGVTWSDPWTPVVGADIGFAGMAAETAAQGGRIYLLQVKVTLTSQTVTGVAPYVRWSDDNGRNWSVPLALAGAGVRSPASAAQTWTFYPSAVAVLADGTVLIAGYGGANGHVLLRKSSDRGQTWTAAADITPPSGRILQEPQLCPLADGRIAMTMRSDGTSSQWLYMSVRDLDGTWSTPRVITYDGSGMPTCREIAPGYIAYLYRGWIDRADDSMRPMRIGAMGIDQGTVGRGNIWLDPVQAGRFLYGAWLKRGDGWLIVHSIEGPNGALAPSASIWATPVALRPAPAL